MRALALLVACVAALGCAGPSGDDLAGGRAEQPIKDGAPATAFPEAVYVDAGFLPCSGVVVAPKAVLTAGHCKSPDGTYVVHAPNAGGGQTVNASHDWSPYGGDPATTSDVTLVFLDDAIQLDAYPTLSSSEVAAGTIVNDLGRTLNGSIEDGDYVSPPVTIQGSGASLGFPNNYAATPDISEDGDSGGPIEIDATGAGGGGAGAGGGAAHVVVALVDTDTIEQGIPEASPIDLFVRLDVVHDEIEARIAAGPQGGGGAGGGASAGVGGRQVDGGGGGAASGDAPLTGGGSCAFGGSRGSRGGLAGVALAWLVAAFGARRRRSRPARSPPRSSQ
ncbi:MAG TPA: hypothetical protein VGM56_05605 [Byssovorax sp.]|jgi:hypothetical protein